LNWAALIVGLVALERLAELVYANRNTIRLIAMGGREIGRNHYPLIVALHTAWLLAIYIGAPNVAPIWWLLAFYLFLQAIRYWIIASLDGYWTTRIITLPDAPLVKRGPYRFLRHPNYAVVVAEIAVLPLAFHEPPIALVFSALNAALLWWRIRVENRALAIRP
jgi:methyltransferase